MKTVASRDNAAYTVKARNLQLTTDVTNAYLSLIAAARALGKPVIFIRNVPAHLAPGLDWVAASCDAVSDDGFGVQLARFNPIGLAGSRSGNPVYAGPRDPRQAPAVRTLLDTIAADTGPGSVGPGCSSGADGAGGDGGVACSSETDWTGDPALPG